MAEYKEVFMLFDKDQDGVLSFTELGTAMKALGQRPSGKAWFLMLSCLVSSSFYALSNSFNFCLFVLIIVHFPFSILSHFFFAIKFASESNHC